MKLLLKQRFFSWFDSYDIYNEFDEVAFHVEGQLSWGHLFKIYDAQENELGEVKQRIFTFLPQFEVSAGGHYIGCIEKEFTFFNPRFNIDYNGWQVEGDCFGWEYEIIDEEGYLIATISKELFKFTDTYTIEYEDENLGVDILMLVLAIDAAKCSSKGS